MISRRVDLILFHAREGEVVLGDDAIVLGHFGRMATFRYSLTFLRAQTKAARARERFAHSPNHFSCLAKPYPIKLPVNIR
jgi:hypothetical protein